MLAASVTASDSSKLAVLCLVLEEVFSRESNIAVLTMGFIHLARVVEVFFHQSAHDLSLTLLTRCHRIYGVELALDPMLLDISDSRPGLAPFIIALYRLLSYHASDWLVGCPFDEFSTVRTFSAVLFNTRPAK
jgi:hypothetical protein